MASRCAAAGDGGRFRAYYFLYQPRLETRFARNKKLYISYVALIIERIRGWVYIHPTPNINKTSNHHAHTYCPLCICVCVRIVCCQSIYSGRQDCGHTSRGHTGGRLHTIPPPSSAVLAVMFFARRIQPFLSLVDREVEFCVLTN